ncbi:MAG: hypothetical protein CMP59_00150 [Flavobacteriales bacterium]|nr:hypothetical protein [Flavobacteriales bacterium]
MTSAQESSERKSLNKARPKYVEFGLNVGHSYFRDLATSPIFSTGAVNGANFHYHRFDSLKESRFGFSALSGTHGFTIGNEVSTSTFTTLQLDYGRLFPFDLISNEHYKFKFGGLLIANFNIRSDQSLQNAGLGYEVVYNLMASAKVSRDVSRNTAKSGKFLWLIPYDWQPRKRLLSYQLNIGLVNANVRNGYAYVNQSGLTNEFPLFADYENNLFSGFRMNAALRYTIYLHNGNALRFSYVWDAYTTGGEVDQFELANHLFSAALLFDLSNW